VRSPLPFALAFVCLAACKSATPFGLDVTAGQEKDAFSADPAVTRVDVAVTSLDGSVNLTVSAAPGETFDLGTVKDDQQIGVEVTGVDATGATVMRGRSLYGIPLTGISGALPIFAQRTGQWARPPVGLKQAHVGGVGAVLGERYVLVTGGATATGDVASADPKQLDAYDLLNLTSAVSTAFPRTPASLASLGEVLLLIDATGATWVDYTSDSTYDATLPTGLASFGDLAGGATVAATDGSLYVVGGTRPGATTRAVLQIGTDGTLTAFATVAARKGAAALWIDTIGLVIAGGAPDGAGVEVLASGATAFAQRGYPADATEGAGAVTDGGKGLALIGGTLGGMPAATRILDPACLGDSCAAKESADATLPGAFARVSAYALAGTQILVVADEADGMNLTRSFLVDLVGKVTELPLKEPRRGAIAVPTPLASLAIVGGEHPDGTPATAVELFFTQ
jgi:hypothetical protein